VKIIFVLIFLSLYIETPQSAERSLEEETTPSVAPRNKEQAEEESKEDEDYEWQKALVNFEADVSLDPVLAEEIKEISKMAVSPFTVDDMPIDIFLRKQTLYQSLRANGGFMLKSLPKIIAEKACNYFPLLRGIPALHLYASQMMRGDIDNFPPISVRYIFQLLDGIEDRQSFARLSLSKRSFPFETDGFNGFGKGYKGYAIVKDFAWGQCLVAPGEELIEIAKNPGKSPLDNLVTLKEHITPHAWLKRHFVETSLMKLDKIGAPYKDSFGNTCALYKLGAVPEYMVLEVMRESEEKFLWTVALWKVAWNRAHTVVAMPSH
jgi:hypothetical protein